jgi:dephospho-CoA kinase
MLNVGLTGGLATGKSVVARELERLGCRLIRLDEIGHQVLEPGTETHAAVVAAFGPSILDAQGGIDRAALGRRVFADAAALDRLNRLVHPAIRARAEALRQEFARTEPDGICVTEAAILIETGSYRDYDCLVVTVCRPEQQLERAVARGRLSRAEAEQRLRRQMPAAEKARYADFVIDTSDTEESTREQTRRVWQELRSRSR